MNGRISYRDKSRWLRFSLRTLLIGMAVLGAILGVVANELVRLRRHRRAETTVSELGGMYAFFSNNARDPWGPWWFPIVRSGLYADVESVSFCSERNEGLTDGDLQVLEGFPRLHVVELCASGITDKGIVHLHRIPGLRRVVLHETQVTSKGLRGFKNAQIEQLILGGASVSDETLECLRAFSKLKKLALYQTSVTNNGLANLKSVPTLEHLYLEKSPVSDEGMCHVAGLTGLKQLELRALDVGDSGIARLVRLTNLESLELEEVGLTDEGVAKLPKLPSLRRLAVVRTAVTDVGLRQLQQGYLRSLLVGPGVTEESLQELRALMPACQVHDASGTIRFHGP
jgi:hypothetical protein